MGNPITQDVSSKVAREVLDRIIEFPETWNQGKWFASYSGNLAGSEVEELVSCAAFASEWSECGSTACVAGHAIAVYKLMGEVHMPRRCDVFGMATDILNLTFEQAQWLFDGERDFDQVEYALTDIANGDTHDWHLEYEVCGGCGYFFEDCSCMEDI